MEQHPVPQNISSYEFRLVGDMTLKQFFQLSAGVVIALIFYASSLPSYIKWPFVILFTFLGIAIAFIPIEERPLHVWIINFIKSAYSPTQYLWQKKAVKPEMLTFEPRFVKKQAPVQLIQDQTKLNEYLETLPTTKSDLDKNESLILERYHNLFDTVVLPQNLPIQAKILAETYEPAGERVRSLTSDVPRMAETLRVEEEVTPQLQPVPTAQPYIPIPKPYVHRGHPFRVLPKSVEFATEENLPLTPEVPNLLAGMVVDHNNRIVEGAILEIKDETGNPVRALRSNKLGHFQIATQLPSGTYEIVTDKEGLIYDTYRVVLKNEIVKSLTIKARGAA
jgi:hypothetical protein